MKKIFTVGTIIAVVGVGVILFTSPPAEAIPAFARKFQVSCDNCHRAFPLLNETGEKFLEQGFQNRSAGSFDGGSKDKSEIDDKLAIEKTTIPLSVRLIGDIRNEKRNGTTPDTKSRFDIEVPHEVEFIIGGTLFKNISYWMEMAWEAGETQDIEQAYIGFNNITGDNTLNVRIGLMPIMQWGQPGHSVLQKKRSILDLRVDNETTAATVNTTELITADGNYRLRKAEQAIEVYGRPGDGALFYNFGISNGQKGFTGRDNNSGKNFYGRIGVNAAGQEVGFFGLMGKSAITGTAPENKFNRIGIDGILRFGDAMVYGQYILGHDENPFYAEQRETRKHMGYFINANYPVLPNVLAVLQFDYTKIRPSSTVSNQRGLRETFLTPALAYYPIQNLRTTVEYQFDLVKRDSAHTHKNDRFNIRLDFIF